jgi:hypothetical protein
LRQQKLALVLLLVLQQSPELAQGCFPELVSPAVLQPFQASALQQAPVLALPLVLPRYRVQAPPERLDQESAFQMV